MDDGGYFGLLSWSPACADSVWGWLRCWAPDRFPRLLSLGPILNFYLSFAERLAGGMTECWRCTGAIFLALSGYAVVSRKDFSFMGSFLMVGILVAFLAGWAMLFNILTPVAGGIGDVHSADVGHDPLADQ